MQDKASDIAHKDSPMLHLLNHHPMHAGGRLLAVLLAAGVLGGCSMLSAVSPLAAQDAGLVAGEQAGRVLEPAFAAFLAQAPQGSILALAESPWGSQVEVTAGEAYLAASGRHCRKLSLMRVAAAQPESAIACQTAQGWEARRLVTQVIPAGGQR